MDYEVELNYRLTSHLHPDETVLATLISLQEGIFAATDRRILGLRNEAIGYRMGIYAYGDIERVEIVKKDEASFVEFHAAGRRLCVRSRSGKEARRFTDVANRQIERCEKDFV